MLSIKNLHKSYGDKKVLQGIDIEVKAGDIYGFIGKNGAGKTTTIKSIVGINTFNNGSITIDGKDILTNALDCKKITAYIPDNPELYEFMSGLKYINFIENIFDLDKIDSYNRAMELAEVFDIKNDLNDPISSYSHGMKQKLAIISALIHNPKLLILDEPFVGLDPSATRYLKDEFKKMVDKGSAIFFSTHVLEVAQNLCNKIGIIKDGKIVISGYTKDVVSNSSLEDIFMELVKDEN